MYRIINEETIKKRIEELEKTIPVILDSYTDFSNYGKLEELKSILSNSIPLISEIEKAYEAGKLDKEYSLLFDNPKGRYLSTLKYEI